MNPFPRNAGRIVTAASRGEIHFSARYREWPADGGVPSAYSGN
jgi:hypothetical protein